MFRHGRRGVHPVRTLVAATPSRGGVSVTHAFIGTYVNLAGHSSIRFVEKSEKNLPERNSIRTRLGWAEPEVVFRIIHVALAGGSPPQESSPSPTYREQTVEVALGPNPAFQGGSMDRLSRRVPPGQVVNAVPASRRNARPPKAPKTVGPPRIVKTLHKAIEWRRQLDADEVPNQAAVARREGITRARVTQVLSPLRLPLDVRTRLLAMRGSPQRSGLSEHTLRRFVRALGSEDHHDAAAPSPAILASRRPTHIASESTFRHLGLHPGSASG